MATTFSSLNNPELIKMIKAGKVGVIPTDTIYGLVASATNKKAASNVLNVKGRPNKPGTLVASSTEQLVNLGIKRRYLTAVKQFWPGGVSVVMPMPENLDYLHIGKKTLPVRIPDNKAVLDLLNKVGPLITTSANLPDQKPSTNLRDAKGYFGDNVDFYVDGGDLSDRDASTIIRVIDDAIEILRQGTVKLDENGRITK